MSHTPLKPELIRESKKGLVMIAGSMDVIGVAEDVKIRNFITAD